MNSKTLAIIPARGGSKGLPKKNITELGGKPLIVWTIEASLNSKYICQTLVSSDCNEILDISKSAGASTLKRPLEHAEDCTPSEIVINHALENIKEHFDYVILLQPTSPFRNSEDIDKAFTKLLFTSDANSLISGYKLDNKVLKAFIENDDGFLEGITNNKYPFMRRQDLPSTYMSNGAIYIAKVNSFLKFNSFLTDKTISYEMSITKSLDIDSKEDMIRAQKYLIKNSST